MERSGLPAVRLIYTWEGDSEKHQPEQHFFESLSLVCYGQDHLAWSIFGLGEYLVDVVENNFQFLDTIS